jgi:hypothetical protein
MYKPLQIVFLRFLYFGNFFSSQNHSIEYFWDFLFLFLKKRLFMSKPQRRVLLRIFASWDLKRMLCTYAVAFEWEETWSKHVSSSSYDMCPPPHMTCILLLIWHVSSSSYAMYPPPHMTCILLLIWHVCILLLIWHVSSSSYAMCPPPHMTFLYSVAFEWEETKKEKKKCLERLREGVSL